MNWKNHEVNVIEWTNISSCTKWRLGDNVVLWLMKCLTRTVSFGIFMDDYFLSFRLLTHLGFDNIQADVLNKNMLCKYHWGQTAAKKRNVDTLNSAHQAKKV